MASRTNPVGHGALPMPPEGQHSGGWRAIKTAPEDVPVIVLTAGGQVFKARLTYGYASDKNESGLCWGWSVDDCDVRPECWSDGVCWASNEDEEPSDQPIAWMPFNPATPDLSGPQRSEAALSATDEPISSSTPNLIQGEGKP